MKLRGNVESWARSATGHALPGGADGAAFVRCLAQWTLDYAVEGDGLGFPFDRPYLDFYRRCRTIRRAADASLRKESGDACGRREMKQGERRRSGRKVLTYDFEQFPAGAALVANLARPDYVEILCGSLDRLPEAFAELDAAERDEDIAACETDGRSFPDEEVLSRSMPYQDRALIRSEALRAWIQSAAQSRAPMAALGAR